jgi:hypothetical protein
VISPRGGASEQCPDGSLPGLHGHDIASVAPLATGMTMGISRSTGKRSARLSRATS